MKILKKINQLKKVETIQSSMAFKEGDPFILKTSFGFMKTESSTKKKKNYISKRNMHLVPKRIYSDIPRLTRSFEAVPDAARPAYVVDEGTEHMAPEVI